MSVLNRTPKVKKTADLSQYYKDYRETHLGHIRNLDKVKYYKKKGLTDDDLSRYGEFAGEMFKLKNLIISLRDREPILLAEIITLVETLKPNTDTDDQSSPEILDDMNFS
jgi:hypothetical protein